MSETHELLLRFYEALQRRDAAAVGACYHEQAIFMDPAFGRLNREEVCAMWSMLLGQSRGLEMSFRIHHADEASGSGTWEPRYTFSKTGRPVHNVIESQFGFLEGAILAHRDRFSLWRWSRQALGLPGLLLGWTPFLHRRIRAQARQALEAYMEKTRS